MENESLCLFFVDAESERSPKPAIDKIINEMNSKLTELVNETKSFSSNRLVHSLQETARRHRRGIWDNWKYGRWCGAKQGGYKNEPKPSCKYICKKTTSYVNSACRKCLPPKDMLDAACMEHDR